MRDIKTAADLVADANQGIVGINDALEVYEGYDGSYPQAFAWVKEPADYGYEPGEWMPLSAEEKRKLADIMIARWQRYKEAADGATNERV